jgi:hypothetical protein
MRGRDGLGAARRALLELEVSSSKGTGGVAGSTEEEGRWSTGERNRRKRNNKKIEIRNKKIYNNDPDLDMSLPLTGSARHVSPTMGPTCQE